MPVIEFQRLPPETDEGEISNQGNFVAMYSMAPENPNYNVRLAKWLGVLQLSIALCSVIDGIVTTTIGYCNIAVMGTPIWCGFPCFFVAGVMALMSRNKKTKMIRMYMMSSFIAMLAALLMMCFMLVSAIHEYHQGYPFMYVRDEVASKLLQVSPMYLLFV
ncbi:uncharacterized protein LOC110978274 isoform X2 [Acanthaster planci]|uniref:Uncharacterized protein LOC110978274 isoform X2 n=1 Tax=Acanthaster planci TaxID=133434 RepID=A0A8B7YAV9_ACAPL|nr:uncharacterized protein LOC110978274 isoform X2 [Acanthaster planci]